MSPFFFFFLEIDCLGSRLSSFLLPFLPPLPPLKKPPIHNHLPLQPPDISVAPAPSPASPSSSPRNRARRPRPRRWPRAPICASTSTPRTTATTWTRRMAVCSRTRPARSATRLPICRRGMMVAGAGRIRKRGEEGRPRGGNLCLGTGGTGSGGGCRTWRRWGRSWSRGGGGSCWIRWGEGARGVGESVPLVANEVESSVICSPGRCYGDDSYELSIVKIVLISFHST